VSPYPLKMALRIAIDQMAMRPKQKFAMKSQFGLINISLCLLFGWYLYYTLMTLYLHVRIMG